MMALDRLQSLIDAYGADAERWPADERAAALLLIARSAEARAYLHDARQLDALLDQAPMHPVVTVDPEQLAAAIARTPARPSAARAPRPGLKRGAGSWLGFGWPNFAALAAAGLVGFMIGWTDLNSATTAPSRGDLLDAMAPVSGMDDSVW